MSSVTYGTCLSDLSQDWLPISFQEEVEEEVVATTLRQLQRQESHTYKRMFTPPQKDKHQEEINQMLQQVKLLTKETVVQMMMFKKAQMNAQNDELREDFKFSKEANHLLPIDIERIEETYNPVLE